MTQTKRTAGRNLPAAITTGMVLIAVVVATLLWWNWGFALFVAIALTAGVWEVCGALEKSGAAPARWPLLVGTPLVVLGSYFVAEQLRRPDLALVVVIGLLVLLFIVILFSRVRFGVNGFIRDVTSSAFVLGYLPLLGATITLMLADNRPTARILCFILAPIASDTGGFVIGVLFGRHKMAPAISPAKSWEGFAGGLAVAMIAEAFAVHFLLDSPVWVGLILGLVAGCCAVVGDLVESAIKRDSGLKDMSHILPGHGGVMDRLDSLLAAAPAAWLVMYLLVRV